MIGNGRRNSVYMMVNKRMVKVVGRVGQGLGKRIIDHHDHPLSPLVSVHPADGRSLRDGGEGVEASMEGETVPRGERRAYL